MATYTFGQNEVPGCCLEGNLQSWARTTEIALFHSHGNTGREWKQLLQIGTMQPAPILFLASNNWEQMEQGSIWNILISSCRVLSSHLRFTITQTILPFCPWMAAILILLQSLPWKHLSNQMMSSRIMKILMLAFRKFTFISSWKKLSDQGSLQRNPIQAHCDMTSGVSWIHNLNQHKRELLHWRGKDKMRLSRTSPPP